VIKLRFLKIRGYFKTDDSSGGLVKLSPFFFTQLVKIMKIFLGHFALASHGYWVISNNILVVTKDQISYGHIKIFIGSRWTVKKFVGKLR
jgi:hypothetical protein